MRRLVIISALGEKKVFDWNQFHDFHHWLFVCLAGEPKVVTIISDESVNYDEVYKIQYA